MLAVVNAIADPSKKHFSRTVPYFGALEQPPENSWTKSEGRLKKQKNTIASLRQSNEIPWLTLAINVNQNGHFLHQ